MLNVDPKEMLLLALNLLVLYLILRKFLFAPVTRLIEARQARIREQLSEAEAKRAEAEQLHEAYDEKLAAASQQARELLQNAKITSERDYQTMMQKAKTEAQELIASTQEQLARERVEMLDGVRQEVATLAILAASRVSAGRLGADTDESLLEAFLEETGDAP